MVLELIRFVKAQPIFVSTETTSTGRYARDLQTAQASQELHLLKMMASILKAMLFGCSSSDSSGFRGNVVSYTRSFGCFLAASRGRPITHLSKTTLEKLARLFLAMATHYMKDKDEVPAQIATKGLDLTLEYFAQRNEFTEVSQMLIDTDIDVDNDNDDNYSNDNEDDDDDIDDSNSSFNSVVLNLLFRNYNLNNQQFFNNRNH